MRRCEKCKDNAEGQIFHKRSHSYGEERFGLINLDFESRLRSERLKCVSDAGSADMSTISVALATVKRGMSSISADGEQFSHAVVNCLRN